MIKEQLNPELEILVRKQLEGNEFILSAWEYAPGEVQIMLTSQDQRSATRRGGGRILEFKLQGGAWVFRFAGRWIS